MVKIGFQHSQTVGAWWPLFNYKFGLGARPNVKNWIKKKVGLDLNESDRLVSFDIRNLKL